MLVTIQAQTLTLRHKHKFLKKMFAVLIYTDRFYSISHITCSLLFIFLFLYRIVFVCFDLQDLSSLTRD